MKALDILKKAREILTPEKAWTKGSYYQNEKGSEIIGLDTFPMKNELEKKGAIQFCAIGACGYAIAMLNGDSLFSEKWDAQNRVYELLAEAIGIKEGDKSPSDFENFVINFNDTDETTHPEILAIFDLAIEQAEK